MTSFVNQQFQSVFGDTLTTTNQGNGLSTTLQPLQDGFGNNSTVTIATNAINFDRSGPNTFQLDSISLTASSTQINSICGGSPVFVGDVPVTLTIIPADPVGSAGMIYYNSTTNQFRAYVLGTGWVALNHSP